MPAPANHVFQQGVFRQEAVAQHENSGDEWGALLRIAPPWTEWVYGLLLVTWVGALLLLTFGRMYVYASGPAVVRIEGRVDLTAKDPGAVAQVLVQPGQRVSAGQVLVRLYEVAEANELAHIDREFELLLTRTLRDPSDQAARQQLSALRAARELAQARLAERAVRAPRDGTVGDVRIRPGQHLGPGDMILSLLPPDARLTLLAFLPGHSRPLLRPGLELRVELAGYRYAYQLLRIESVGEEVVGPAEIRRALPQELADSLTLAEPAVLVRASLPRPDFTMDGERFRFHEGMLGTAEARLRLERILLTLIPALRAVTHGK